MSERFVVGDTVTLTNTFAVSGTATDPTTISLVVTDPTGTATTYTYAGGTITRAATGQYTKTLVASTVGRWLLVWTGTGAAADVALSSFEVYSATPPLPGSWTYSGDPTYNSRDAVRFLIGDTDSATPLMTDGEIAYLVANERTTTLAAAAGCRALAAKFSRQADKEVDDLKIKASQRAAAYAARAAELTAADDAVLLAVRPWAGGISHADKEATEADADRVPPQFARNDFTNPGGAEDDGTSPTRAWRDL